MNEETRESVKGTLAFIAGTAVILGICGYHFMGEYNALQAEIKERKAIEVQYQKDSIDSLAQDSTKYEVRK